MECLSCGQPRILRLAGGRIATAGECPRCGYLGWARAADVTERLRRLLREVPLAARRIAGPRAA